MPKKLLVLFISVFVLSCNSDDNSIDCSLVDCEVASNTIRLRFLSPENDENLLVNGTIDSEDIQVFNEQNQTVTFSIEEYPSTGMIVVVPVSTEEFGQKSFTIDIKGESSSVSFNTTFRRGECCGPYTEIDDVETIISYDHTLEEYGNLPLSITFYIPSS